MNCAWHRGATPESRLKIAMQEGLGELVVVQVKHFAKCLHSSQVSWYLHSTWSSEQVHRKIDLCEGNSAVASTWTPHNIGRRTWSTKCWFSPARRSSLVLYFILSESLVSKKSANFSNGRERDAHVLAHIYSDDTTDSKSPKSLFWLVFTICSSYPLEASSRCCTF